MQTVAVFGNPDLPQDSLPLRILPELRKKFPGVRFLVLDPNEEWPFDAAQGKDEDLTIIDTVQGIQEIEVFTDLDTFEAAPRVSMHDFDALANLRFMIKLGKIRHVRIIGVPPSCTEAQAVNSVIAKLRDK